MSTRDRHQRRRYRPAGRTTFCRGARAGFTLIEFFVASLLAVILMVVLAGLLQAIWQQNANAGRRLSRYLPTRILEEQIRRDVLNARAFARLPGGVRLAGFLATGRVAGRTVLRSAEVRYQVVGPPLQRRLIRTEIRPGSPGVAELLWVGAAAIDFEDLGALEQTGLNRSERFAGMAPLGREVQVIIRDIRGRVICSENILRH